MEHHAVEYGLMAYWLFLSVVLVFAWHWGWRIARTQWRANSRWSDVWLVIGAVVHLNLIVCLGAFALAPRRPPWFDPRALPNTP